MSHPGTEPNQKDQTRESSATFTDYRDLAKAEPDTSTNGEAADNLGRLTPSETVNAAAIHTIAAAAIPQPDERFQPLLAAQRRADMLEALSNYAPELANSDNALVYNLVQGVLESTPVSDQGPKEAAVSDRLQAVVTQAFGPEGPVLVTDTEFLDERPGSFDWHGRPIELTLGSAQATSLRLFRDGDMRWHLFSAPDPDDGPAGAPHVGMTVDESVVVPPEGIVLGKKMSVQGLDQTRARLEGDPAISGKHVSLRSLPNGRVEVTNHSKNGVEVRVSFWQKRPEEAKT